MIFKKLIIPAMTAAAALMFSPAYAQDLYLCSGQSNMELPVSRCMDAIADNVAGYSNTSLHYVKTPLTYVFSGPQDQEPPMDWQTLDSPQTAQKWGALCYFIARGLNEATGREIEILNSSVGGTPINAWIPEQYLDAGAASRLELCKDDSWVAKQKAEAQAVYSDWQAELDSRCKEGKPGRWKRVDIFSDSWSTDDSARSVFGLYEFRKTVRLSRKQARTGATLHLGAIIDADSVFVNGSLVGSTSYRYPPRHYAVPAEVLRKGRNEIVVRLQSQHSVHGSFVPEKRYGLETAGKEINLEKGWKYRLVAEMPERKTEIFLQYEPSGLYNAMIHPFRNMDFKGVIWYQGESDIDNAGDYARKLETLVKSWREAFGKPDFPFYIVELASYEHSERETAQTSAWVQVQDAQREVCSRMHNVFLIPNRDQGEWNDIHPQNKKTLGERVVKAILENGS